MTFTEHLATSSQHMWRVKVCWTLVQQCSHVKLTDLLVFVPAEEEEEGEKVNRKLTPSSRSSSCKAL